MQTGCDVPGCPNKHMARGWCSMHYERWRTHGDPLRSDRIFGDPVARFWATVGKGPDCWTWSGALTNGYGSMSVDYKNVPAHRFSYELLVGPIPDGMVLDHLCHNEAAARGECAGGSDCLHRQCTNPAHLAPVDRLRNARSSPLHNANKTHCQNGHPYDRLNVGTAKGSGGRYCSECRYEHKVATGQISGARREFRKGKPYLRKKNP